MIPAEPHELWQGFHGLVDDARQLFDSSLPMAMVAIQYHRDEDGNLYIDPEKSHVHVSSSGAFKMEDIERCLARWVEKHYKWDVEKL